MDNQIKELESKIAKLTALRNQLLQGGKRWRTEVRKKYWAIMLDGSVKESLEDLDKVDLHRYSTGNYFHTESEAQHANNRMLATQQIKDRIAELNAQHGWVADWGDDQQNKYWIIFGRHNNRMSLDSGQLHAWAPVEFYGSKQTIETVIKEMPEQIKLYLGVE